MTDTTHRAFDYLETATDSVADAADFCLDLLCFLRCTERNLSPDHVEDEQRITAGRAWVMSLIETAVTEIARHAKQDQAEDA